MSLTYAHQIFSGSDMLANLVYQSKSLIQSCFDRCVSVVIGVICAHLS